MSVSTSRLRRPSLRVAVWLFTAAAFAACSDDPSRPDASAADAAAVADAAAPDGAAPDAAETPDGGATPDAAESRDAGATSIDAGTSVECPVRVPECQDESIARLTLRTTPSDGTIVEEGTTPGVFLTLVDSTGGGLNTPESYVYARFGAAGLEKVAIDDEAALESTEWDIAFRRYVARINSGVSGPGCVVAARTPDGTDFDALGAVPGGLRFNAEAYFTPATCSYVSDTSGIGAPATVLGGFWSYPGCVAMTKNVYIVRTRSGRHVKLRVESYYTPSVQETCDATGTAPMPSGAGNLRVRWAWID
jgi:hypothetical protein